jgi:hypothetical protein
MIKKRKLPIKPRVVVDKTIFSNQFAFCLATLNGDKKLKIVSDLSEKDIIKKCLRKKSDDLRSISVEVLKIYNKIQ